MTAEEHRAIVDDFCQFVSGQAAPMIKKLEREMRAASDALEYERAARLRDDIGALQRAMERNAVVCGTARTPMSSPSPKIRWRSPYRSSM